MPAESIQSELPIPAQVRHALVDRVASGVVLRRAARLRAFLLYVCEQTLDHGKTVLHEQEIGVAVFGRPASYDTGVDNIVRVNATELRKRLEQYFAEEGAGEPVVLEIQRGSYTPVFRRRVVAPGVAGPIQRLEEAVSAAAGRPAGDEEEISDLERPVAPVEAVTRGPFLGWKVAAALLFLLAAALGWRLHLVEGTAERAAEQNIDACGESLDCTLSGRDSSIQAGDHDSAGGYIVRDRPGHPAAAYLADGLSQLQV